ncbi:PcfJ family protein [Brevibacillus sp. HB1.1]|uniref:PcfJ domain-containing protein n=1 Tax=Brevibacillus sp. HB1.1 TaxID=2738808 RepID=UPI001576927D|nr:PcfJ domain-containing protein [Brevibacillus sp. HB1.1]NTU28870.1 PcfJ family protein [Brevibacillus sp. HB1.1]
MSDKHKEFLAHFPEKMDKEFYDYVENTVLLSSRYLFLRRKGKDQFGYCTHCRTESKTPSLYGHNETQRCKKCYSVVTTKHAGKGRSRLIDDAYIVWYGKSLINPNVLTARGVYVRRDYSGDFREVRTGFMVQSEYLFECGNPRGKGKERFGKGRMMRRGWPDRFYEPMSIYTEMEHSMQNKPLYLNEENIATAVDGTPFQYCQWREYFAIRTETEDIWRGFNQTTRRAGEAKSDLVKFFELAAKYPCIEYATKLGLADIVKTKIDGGSTLNVINWRGATLEKVLRLSKNEIDLLRRSNLKMTPLALHSYHYHKKQGLQLTFQQAYDVRDLTFEHNEKTLEEIEIPKTQAIKYILKQLRRPGSAERYSSAGSVVSTWRDYLRECHELEIDTSKESVLFPNNLDAAHKKTIEKVKIKADESLNILIAARLTKLNKLSFEHGDFFIRPAKDSIELFWEGKTLKHCVGGYAKAYAEGKSNIFVIRKLSEPDTPFFTIEVKDNRITQAHGLSHRLPTPDVQAFINLFVSKKLLTKKQTRIEVTAINQNMQEVAV